ncbi:putative predicted 2Fe-2S cluster-containing protein [Serratia symbiotica str. Tucson]|uniref:Predicted 2Fe-2S cluster-containing protein n=2 Tax=Serratia symbiotica TaxID=138074 RepID=A0A455VKI3_9GAMM|nr:YcbX family protein [Serratia symbiotica]EFW11437.1 putative predicted 2Fe-2S cluster-containing protein [Serratia symbiotica str. Tucson]BBI92050.1 predicted 2Fe-2S cluster-containing protein [Serratia symbiotica]
MITLARLYVHPVKSLRGLQLSHAQVSSSGLAFDRTFMITDVDGTFITARQYPQMVLFTPALLANGLFLTAPDGVSAAIHFSDFATAAQPTEVWGNHFTALIAPAEINRWLSGYFQHDVQLRWLGTELSRRVKKHPEIPLSFADGYPYLLINQASFNALQQRCPSSIKLEQFRPNLVIAGASAWAEDGWQRISVGDVRFDLVKPCSRCVLTTVSTEHGRKHPNGEPLRTLQEFRTADNGNIDFGQNMIACNSGIIRVGDTVEVLSTKPPRAYGASNLEASLAAPQDNVHSVTIEYEGQIFTGNNQQILLEQLEQQGIRVPYSCRAGICGNCRITLVSGEVAPLKNSALAGNSSILCCSCIPKSDLTLA